MITMKYYRYSMDMGKLNLFCIVLFIPIFVVIYYLGYGSYIDLTTFILYFLWMFLHEFLHGIGFSLSKGIDHKNIVYGANLEKGIFYCMCKERISKRGIMVSLLLPFFLIGVITLIIGFIFNIPILILLSLFNILGSVGDIVMFLSFIRLPFLSYVDIDDCTGFVLISKKNLSKYKLFGLKLEEKGNISKLETAKDYKKITISKLSLIIFILLIVSVLIMSIHKIM